MMTIARSIPDAIGWRLLPGHIDRDFERKR
jgi:hypothetical protein